MPQTRRGFLQTIASGAAGLALAAPARAGAVPRHPQSGAPKPGQYKIPAGAKMPMRTLGKTGEKVSLVGLGGYHIGIPKDDAEGIHIIQAAVDHGVTFLDNCWDYNDGLSEDRMGRALQGGRRDKVLLMTKLD